jgi:hypothetical protein
MRRVAVGSPLGLAITGPPPCWEAVPPSFVRGLSLKHIMLLCRFSHRFWSLYSGLFVKQTGSVLQGAESF